ncbi:hypothetical protein C8R43DRAFT_960086 [Mycena crocata]|nr:hypothetical protein C8R43DRAFT_960086 [Mycena crocata]
MAISTEQPALPPDLERVIFEIAAILWPLSVTRLILVSKLEPFLYHTLTVSENGITAYPLYQAPVLRTVIQHRQAGFQKHVRNILLDSPPTHCYREILAVCNRVENLWLSSLLNDVDLYHVVASLRLCCFYGDVQPLLRTLPPTHQFFVHLSHMELMGSAGFVSAANLGIWSNISNLPRLTHLSFNDDAFIDIAPALLQSCKCLTLLIHLEQFGPCPDHWYSKEVTSDARYFVKDWQVGVQTGLDYWARAEDFVKHRQLDIMAASQFRMGDDASTGFV